jgi:hypothetical protein
MLLNREMRVTNMNCAQEAFLQRLGTWISWIDAIGMPISELSDQDADRDWSGITDQVLARGETYADPQRAYETSDGELVLSVEISPLKDGAGKTIVAIQVSEDVKEKLKQVEVDAKRIADVTKRLWSVEEVKTKEYISEGSKMLDLGLEG